MGRHGLVRAPARAGRQRPQASWKPGLTYVVRIREAGKKAWSFGFETPLMHISLVDLKPDTEYELQVCARNAAGECKPQLLRMRTNPAGRTDYVIPLPRR